MVLGLEPRAVAGAGIKETICSAVQTWWYNPMMMDTFGSFSGLQCFFCFGPVSSTKHGSLQSM